MAQLYKTKNGKTLVAFSIAEKEHIYSLGKLIHDHCVANPPGVPDWNSIDRNAIEIPLLCKPFIDGGSFIDLQLPQIRKYEKALVKAFGTDFFKVFDIKLENTYLTKDDIRKRMDEGRELRRQAEELLYIRKRSAINDMFSYD